MPALATCRHTHSALQLATSQLGHQTLVYEHTRPRNPATRRVALLQKIHRLAPTRPLAHLSSLGKTVDTKNRPVPPRTVESAKDKPMNGTHTCACLLLGALARQERFPSHMRVGATERHLSLCVKGSARLVVCTPASPGLPTHEKHPAPLHPLPPHTLQQRPHSSWHRQTHHTHSSSSDPRQDPQLLQQLC